MKRTDAGVHATNSTVHIDLDRNIPPHVITKRLNTTFQAWNEQLRILKTTPVSNEFDSRRDAWSRTYLYRFAVPKEKVPAGVNPKVFQNTMFIPIEESFRCYFVLCVNQLKIYLTMCMDFKFIEMSAIFFVFHRNEGFQIDRLKEAAQMLEGVHDFRTFMKVSKEQRTMKPRFCWRKINSITIKPGVTLATSFNREKTLATYDFWDIEFVSKAYFYRQVKINSENMKHYGQKKRLCPEEICMFYISKDPQYGWHSHSSRKWTDNIKRCL